MWVGGIVYEGESLMKGRGAGELTAGVSEKGSNPFAGVCLWDSWCGVFVRMEGVGQTMVRGLSVGGLYVIFSDADMVLLLLRVLLLLLCCDDLVMLMLLLLRNVTDNVKGVMWVDGIVYEGESLMKGRGAGELTAGVSEKGAHPFASVCLWDSWGRVFVRMEGVGQTMARGLSVEGCLLQQRNVAKGYCLIEVAA
ncbi:hypothetical protein RHMOL_Rhmol03G0271200 [Rhododendron molle]|uniref:Uncharacterized protein n=1 Tax=Rhododendron molle TaxID=49168 RepID=A0ACC0PK99_RHOML|nr:hypothetical protein RHMOL_Rhmol03G0271200 [Rhododendron molle]